MLADAARASHKPYYLMSSRPGVMNASRPKACAKQASSRSAARARAWRDRPRRPLYDGANRSGQPTHRAPSRTRDLLAAKAGRRTINEYDAKRLLSAFGVPVTREQRVATLDAATRAAREIGYPVVLKVVRTTRPQDRARPGRRRPRGRRRRARFAPEQRFIASSARPSDAAFLCRNSSPTASKVFAGVSRDPDFGLTLAFGMGGIAIEVTRDFALRMLPLREGDAEAMIAETRGAAMLGSIRVGRRPTSRASPPASMRLRTSPGTTPICSTRSISIRSRHCRRARLRRGGCADRREIASARMIVSYLRLREAVSPTTARATPSTMSRSTSAASSLTFRGQAAPARPPLLMIAGS